MRSVHIVISGKVQGVFFRAATKRKAEILKVRGWVRNTGKDVEIKASGSDEAISDLIAWCHEGPPEASVVSVVIKDIPEEWFDHFTIS